MDVGYERDITQSHSKETLRRVKENDESFKCLWIGGGVVHIARDRDDEGKEVVIMPTRDGINAVCIRENSCGVFNPIDDKEFTSLGEYSGEYTPEKINSRQWTSRIGC